MPKAVLRRELDLIEGVGVKFVFNTRVGFDLPLNDLATNFDAVFLSIGTWKESWLYLPGTELKNVFPRCIFLESVARGEKAAVGSRVAIIGGGNAAIDSARTVLRMGAQATILYRRERKDMPAIDEEIQAAEEEGVRFVFLAAPHRIMGGADGNVKAIEIVKTRLGEYDKSGRRRPIPTDEVQRFECDSVILAVGETFDMDFCRASGLELKEEGTIVVDRFTFETSRPGFYAGGDVITGASNMSNAMSGGKQAARKIDERLMGEQQLGNRPLGAALPRFEYSQPRRGEPSLSRRHTARSLPAAARAPVRSRKLSPTSPRRKRWKSAAAACAAICAARRAQLMDEMRTRKAGRPWKPRQTQNHLRSHRRRTGHRARRRYHPRSRARQRKTHSHALLSQGPQRRGRLPPVRG